jgi:anti-sigma B factor antagonist
MPMAPPDEIERLDLFPCEFIRLVQRSGGMHCRLTTRQVGDVNVVDVAGRITAGGGSNTLRETLHELAAKGAKKILINLGEVSYIDSSGIGELVSAFKEVTQRGGQLKLLGLSGHVAYQLLITKSYNFFEMYVDESAAIHSFG